MASVKESQVSFVTPSEDVLYERFEVILGYYCRIPADTLIPVLLIAKGMFGYLPERALSCISSKLQISRRGVAAVLEVYPTLGVII